MKEYATTVLILVLMEDALVLDSIKEESVQYISVLILVLMEDALVPKLLRLLE